VQTFGEEHFHVVGACVAVVFAVFAVACSGPTGDNRQDTGVSGVDVALEIPRGDDYVFQLTEAVETSVVGRGSSRMQRNGRTSLQFTGVANDDENFSLRFQMEAVEGDTGLFDTVRTSQLTHGRSTYKTDRLRVEIETHESTDTGGRIVGAMEGAFDREVESGSATQLSPPVRIAGRFDFEY